MGFSVRHLMVSKTKGRFADFSGTVTIGEDPLESSVQVEIQVASIDTGDETRDGHLRSPDVFDATTFPEMTYRSTGVTAAEIGTWRVDGLLTVRGATQPVALEVTFDGAAKDPGVAPGSGSPLTPSSTGRPSGSPGTRPWRPAGWWSASR